jgi:hypothetical protein
LKSKALRILDGELSNDYEFKKWLGTFGIEDLVIQLLNFEQAEIYEDCIIINKILQRKINKITTVIDLEI